MSQSLLRLQMKMTDWKFKKNPHAPAHLFANQQMYFITGSTLYSKPYMRSDAAKMSLLLILEDFLSRERWKLDHWIILNNHYHFTAQSERGEDLSLIMGNIHRKSAKEIRQNTLLKVSKKVWHNYWDRCIRDEVECFNCLKYMFWNPVKHGYVTEPLNYSWSSFQMIFKNGGDVEDWSFLQDRIDKLPFLPGDFE